MDVWQEKVKEIGKSTGATDYFLFRRVINAAQKYWLQSSVIFSFDALGEIIAMSLFGAAN